jgi:hypothetical protein
VTTLLSCSHSTCSMIDITILFQSRSVFHSGSYSLAWHQFGLTRYLVQQLHTCGWVCLVLTRLVSCQYPKAKDTNTASPDLAVAGQSIILYCVSDPHANRLVPTLCRLTCRSYNITGKLSNGKANPLLARCGFIIQACNLLLWGRRVHSAPKRNAPSTPWLFSVC